MSLLFKSKVLNLDQKTIWGLYIGAKRSKIMKYVIEKPVYKENVTLENSKNTFIYFNL